MTDTPPPWTASNLATDRLADHSFDPNITAVVKRLAEIVDRTPPDNPVTVRAGDVQAVLDLVGSLAFHIGDMEAHEQESGEME